MKNDVIVHSGASGLRLTGSELYLEEGALTGRVKLKEGSSFSLSQESGETQPLPAIHFFSIPGHLFERLWLEDIPGLAGIAGARSDKVRPGGDHSGLDTLSLLLETIESGFGKPVEAIFQSSTPTPGGSADAQYDICDHAGQSVQGGPETGGWRFGAWLNLDDNSHFAHARILEPDKARWTDEAIKLEISPGEGILWPRAQLQLTEAGSSGNETSNKLVLLGGKT